MFYKVFEFFLCEHLAPSKLAESSSALLFLPTFGGYFDFREKAYIYNYVDHLDKQAESECFVEVCERSSVRLSYTKNTSGGATVMMENHFYPFGLQHQGYGVGANTIFNYNGKELQNNGMLDYGARMYMPDIGRWGVVDPLAEKTMQPYSYANNNPIRFADPTGMEGTDWYRNKLTKEVYWKDGSGEIDGHTNLGSSFKSGNLSYAANGYIYDESASGGGKAVENGRLHGIGEVVITHPTAIAKGNLDAARSRLYAAQEAFWGRYAVGVSLGGAYGNASGNLTLAYNLGSEKANLFWTHGVKAGAPSYGLGLQLNQFNAYGKLPNGQNFTNVFQGLEGESTGGSASYFWGGEASKSSSNGKLSPYGTMTRSINLGVGYDVGVTRTNTFSISNWIKTHPQYFRVGHTPQFD